MRLSGAELQWMQARLAQRYAAAGREVHRELERRLAALPPAQALLTSWCYAASPLSDWANYDFSLVHGITYGILRVSFNGDFCTRKVSAERIPRDSLNRDRNIAHSRSYKPLPETVNYLAGF